MEITAALAADLEELSEALDEPGVDLPAILMQLGADVKAAVRSFLGLSITTWIDGQAITLAGREPEHAEVLSSLAIPLSFLTPANSSGQLVLYAGRLGAFVDLAADLSWAIGRRPESFVLDKHCDIDLTVPTPSGIAELSAINQALGALLDQGFTPDQGRTELDRRAHDAGLDTPTLARAMLAALTQPSKTGEV